MLKLNEGGNASRGMAERMLRGCGTTLRYQELIRSTQRLFASNFSPFGQPLARLRLRWTVGAGQEGRQRRNNTMLRQTVLMNTI